MSIKQKLMVIVPLLLAVCLVLTSIFIMYDIKLDEEGQSDEQAGASVGYVSSELIPNEEFIPQFGSYVKKEPSSIRAAKIVPGIDFLTEDLSAEEKITEIDTLIKSIADNRFNTVNVVVNTENTVLFEAEDVSTNNGNVLSLIHTMAHIQNLSVMTTIDLGAFVENSIIDDSDIEKISKIISSENLLSNTDIILFDNYYLDETSENELDVVLLSDAIKNLCVSIVREDSSKYIGLAANGFFKKNEETKEYEYYQQGLTDLKGIVTKKYVDFLYVTLPYSVDNKELNFKNAMKLWETEFSELTDLYFEITYSKYGTEAEWKKPDVIVEQLILINENHGLNFGFDSYSAFLNDKTESKPAVIKYLKGEIVGNYILKELSISAPNKLKFTTYQNYVAIIGASDPEFSLTLNGQPLERNDLGYFSVDLDLELGENVFKFVHKGASKTFKITYKKVVIKEISPSGAMKLDGGSSLDVSTLALAGSSVTATLNDSTIELLEDPVYDDLGQKTEYSNYYGTFVMPIDYESDKNLGTISFKAVSQYGTETKSSGKITVKKSERPAPPPTEEIPLPEGGDYVNVGNTLIAEVVVESAETFVIGDSDRSRPTNNYLPKGTVDFCSPNTTTTEGGAVLRTLRYGRTVYNTHKGSKIIKTYEGTLPDHNEVNIASISNGGRYTTITLDTLWKAPFLFEIKEQEYRNNTVYKGNRDFTVEAVTFTYIDITFTYATVATGDIVFESNPIFSHGEWIKNLGDYTLRLFLNKTGGLYGWTANYNEQNQLVFSFLNPAKIKVDTTNKYGYSLEGITIVVDAGHGGTDPGSYGFIKDPIEINGEKIKVYEHYLNLILAKKLKAELESMGATVILTREDNNTTLNDLDRISFARAQKPDFIISIHRNGSDSSKPNGFNTYTFNPFSANAVDLVYDATAQENLYPVSKWSGVKSHVFYMSRMSDCPVVLTENGFMTNKNNFELMIQDEFNDKCAVALANGILEYFKSIQ